MTDSRSQSPDAFQCAHCSVVADGKEKWESKPMARGECEPRWGYGGRATSGVQGQIPWSGAWGEDPK